MATFPSVLHTDLLEDLGVSDFPESSAIGLLLLRDQEVRKRLRDQLKPIESLTKERDELRSFINSATLATNPIELASAHARLPLLEVAIDDHMRLMKPLIDQRDELGMALGRSLLPWQDARASLNELHDLERGYTNGMRLGRWIERRRELIGICRGYWEQTGKPLPPILTDV